MRVCGNYFEALTFGPDCLSPLELFHGDVIRVTRTFTRRVYLRDTVWLETVRSYVGIDTENCDDYG